MEKWFKSIFENNDIAWATFEFVKSIILLIYDSENLTFLYHIKHHGIWWEMTNILEDYFYAYWNIYETFLYSSLAKDLDLHF